MQEHDEKNRPTTYTVIESSVDQGQPCTICFMGLRGGGDGREGGAKMPCDYVVAGRDLRGLHPSQFEKLLQMEGTQM